MINVTIQNFEAEVVEASFTTPVLVDFWAPWCGPCKTLGPLLEKVEEAYGGRFILAKIDSDQEQQLAQAFGIRSIPTCVLMIGGKPVDGFMGAVPESKIREFLDKHLPSEAELEAEADAEDAQALVAAGDSQAALNKLHEALTLNPGNDDARYDYVKLLIENNLLDEAQAALEPALAQIPRQLRFEALGHFLAAIQFVASDARGAWAPAQFDELIAANKRDFDARFAKARVLLVAGHWNQAMDELLEIIMRDKAWNNELPRKTFVAILELLTPPKPKAAAATPGKSAGGIELTGKVAAEEDPQAQLVSSYRRKLSMALN
ncbi:thioredoxin [Curvibacter sp. APW13]|uniref:thioredoxin n=1 Tax=Curvibacter sp. APW13 TaxID=3077236 RepID=UPI0028DFD84C|nr:thioredoxin [Curvibacter sp. APW13]MDT8990090.1 thioredoxin [Curvibacter sp. APW13]